ncbi:hypothetical protein TTHERM_00383620 (macronuclear) [Tetrahymena thermophila SB210]|uniref:EF-hand domain-containing protein n=1 Tax=Tetrahymena thermophila (strain SB210) TaxID=312017 RepID=Q23F51_TETTS|nr:hypothetical protein TTHERM_00383620 [Tetrahymena thermophila SB210]EAR95302.2 hypothetical protein TTHERM_00383620 [Tetrahymena thermophila SB210]|eukprot:XP_001015547.2 hypothetical protein TTHERM_00383620 [Tetrahymena thermophila SB210]
MDNDLNELKKTGLRHLSNTSQCIVEEQHNEMEFQKTSTKFSVKKRQILNQTNGFQSLQFSKGMIQVIGEKDAKNNPNLQNLNIDSESLNKNRPKNVEEQYEQKYRDIAIAENSTNKNDQRAYIAKERQNNKGLFDEANGFNIQRFLKRVAEEKLYGAFLQTLKNNDMQGQAVNTQRRMQFSLYSPSKTSSQFEYNSQFNQSQNTSPNSIQKCGYETNYTLNSKMENTANKFYNSKRPFSTNQRVQGDQLSSNVNSFYNLGELNSSREQQSINSAYQRLKFNKNKFDLNNKSFYGNDQTIIPSYLNSEVGTERQLVQDQDSYRETTALSKDRRLETPSRNNGNQSIFVSAPMSSLLKKRQKHYSISYNSNNEQVSSIQQSPNIFQSINANQNQTERKIQSALRKTHYFSDIKQKSNHISIDNDFIQQKQSQEGVHQVLAKSLAASPVYKRNEEGPYSQIMNRDNSMKKTNRSFQDIPYFTNNLPSNKTLKQNFSTLKKKNDPNQFKMISASEWKERSISQQFKIIQSEGSLNKNNHSHYYHIKLNHKEQGLHQIFKKISNAPEQQQILNIRTTRANFRQYLLKRYHEGLVEKLISFLEIPLKVDYMTYVRLVEKLLNLTPKQKVVLCFILLDENEDGYICNSDMFSFLRKNQNKLTEIDIKNVSRFAQTELNSLVNYSNEDNELEKILIKKNNLTLTEYKLFQKKGVECLIPTTVKKDTLYHVSFQIIEHSNKYRQTVRQLEETKRNQLQDLKKSKNRVCNYIKDSSFCINFDQFEIHLSRMENILNIFFDILAYISLIQFSYIEYMNYDKTYYANFQSYKSEQVEFKSAYAKLLKQHEENMTEIKPKQGSNHIQIEKVNIPEKIQLNRTLTHRTTPMNQGSDQKNQSFSKN